MAVSCRDTAQEKNGKIHQKRIMTDLHVTVFGDYGKTKEAIPKKRDMGCLDGSVG